MRRKIGILAVSIYSISALQAFQNPVTNAVKGQVIDGKSGAPVNKALVIMRGAEETALGTFSDPSGQFQLDNIKPGSYSITAEHSGFVLDPGSPRTVVTVTAENRTEVTLKLIRTAALSGRVFDEDGEPVTGANVEIMPLSHKHRGRPSASVQTNDRGEYRAFNIPPGKYRIAVSYTPSFQHMKLKLQAPGNAAATPGADAYAVTYYPAAADANLAQLINVEAGAELAGLDVQMIRGRGVSVKGSITPPGGSMPAVVVVILSPAGRFTGSQPHDSVLQNGSRSFQIDHVLPGTYILTATAPLPESTVAERAIQVGNADIEGIQLTLAPPQTIHGIVVPPEGRKIPPGLMAVLSDRGPQGRGGGIGQLGKDGTFQIKNVIPADYDLALANGAAGNDLYVSAIQVGDEDALSSGLHVGTAPVGQVKITLRANGGTVQAIVKDASGKPQPDFHVEIVPAAPRRAQMALYAKCKPAQRARVRPRDSRRETIAPLHSRKIRRSIFAIRIRPWILRTPERLSALAKARSASSM